MQFILVYLMSVMLDKNQKSSDTISVGAIKFYIWFVQNT